MSLFPHDPNVADPLAPFIAGGSQPADGSGAIGGSARPLAVEGRRSETKPGVAGVRIVSGAINGSLVEFDIDANGNCVAMRVTFSPDDTGQSTPIEQLPAVAVGSLSTFLPRLSSFVRAMRADGLPAGSDGRFRSVDALDEHSSPVPPGIG